MTDSALNVVPVEEDTALLEAMLRIRSLSRQEGELAQFLRGEMQRRGFEARVDEVGNAVGVRGDATSGPTILLLGHMDTVPGDVPVRREGRVLFGRGAVDAKGPLATFIAAATDFAGPGRVVVIGAVEEEAATSRGARHVLERYEPDFAVIGEPSQWDRVTVGYKGRLLATYRVEQSMAHTAGDQRSVCERAVEFWQRVVSAAEELDASRPAAIFERLQPSLRAMRSGSDGLLDHAELDLGFRLPPSFDLPAWEARLHELARDGSVALSGREHAVRVEKNTPLARAFLSAIRASGGEPRFVVKTGTSDLNVIATRWRCPMLAYGPGDSRFDHTPEEQIDLREYAHAVDVLRHVLFELAG